MISIYPWGADTLLIDNITQSSIHSKLIINPRPFDSFPQNSYIHPTLHLYVDPNLCPHNIFLIVQVRLRICWYLPERNYQHNRCYDTPVFAAVLFSHISGDFASVLTPLCECEEKADAGETVITCYHPQSNYRDNGLWRQVTQGSQTTQTLIFNDILFSSPGDGMLEQRLWLSGELRRGISSSNDIQNLNDDIKTLTRLQKYHDYECHGSTLI